tara:strand:+ start:4891 stop:7443 length:2553 start_codon:yes stop_codon:yes gene_type:complete
MLPRLFLLTALILLLPSNLPAFDLIRNGRAASVIVVADQPSVMVQEAAKELQYHLKEMSGAEVPIIQERDLEDSSAFLILVGQSDKLAQYAIDTTKLSPETFLVKTFDNALVLAGEDGGSRAGDEPYFSTNVRSGTLFAVYDFLHDRLGCRWIWPGKTGEVIPRRTTVVVEPIDIQETPKLLMRHFRSGIDYAQPRCEQHFPRYHDSISKHYTKMSEDQARWLKRMKFGRSDKPQYGHAFTDWYDRYSQTHPEIFALQDDGQRGLPSASYPKAFVKLCVSSDKLVELLIEDFLKRRKKNPELRWLNACENDGGAGFCICEQCRHLDGQLDPMARDELRSRGLDGSEIDEQFGATPDRLPRSLSNRYFHFYNKLARRLARVAPDASVVTYAYSRYRLAPIGMKLEPNILVGLIGFNHYPATDALHRRELANLKAWKQSGIEELFFRPNSFFFSPANGIPWDASLEMGNDLKMLIENGIVATDFDILNGHWSTASPTYYVTARLHWDHDANVKQLRREFMNTFGPAADAIESYFDLWAKAFRDAYRHEDFDALTERADPYGGDIGRRKAVAFFLTPEHFQRASELLREARQAVGHNADPDLVTRIDVLELGLKHGEALMHGARFAIAKNFEEPTRYEDYWPKVKEIHDLRERLLALGAHDIFWLNSIELRLHDMYATRVYYDFWNRPYVPVLEPPESNWAFVPDPESRGEQENWFAKELKQPRSLRRNPRYNHLFYSTWDSMKSVRGWKRSTGVQEIATAWYQTTFSIPETDFRPNNVIYVPYIKGAATIWVNDRQIRSLTAEEGSSDSAIAIPLSEIDVKPDQDFRLTIRVHSPQEAGGLIGPVYVAKRSH